MLPPKSQTQPIPLSDGLHFQWILDGAGYIVTLTDMSRDTVDALTEVQVTQYTTWAKDQPFLQILDASTQILGMSPYLQRQVRDRMVPVGRASGLEGIAVMIAPPGVIGQAIKIVMNTFRNREDTIQLLWVSDMDEAWKAIEAYRAEFQDNHPESVYP